MKSFKRVLIEQGPMQLTDPELRDFNGYCITVDMDWLDLKWMLRKAAGNKSRRSKDGLITVAVTRDPLPFKTMK